MSLLHTTVSPTDSSRSGIRRGGVASISDDEVLEPNRRSRRRTRRGVRIIEFQAAYKSFFLRERILAGFDKLLESSKGGSMKAQWPSQTRCELCRATHQFVQSKKQCKLSTILMGSQSTSMLESVLVGSSLVSDVPSIQSTPTSINGTTVVLTMRN